VGGLGYTIEGQGVATTQISLVREHTEKIRPPRALWVPFPMGRPLGAPGDAAFQRRVLVAALELAEAESGPVLMDFPDEAPGANDLTGWTCPIPLPRSSETRAENLGAELAHEIAQLRPWYEFAVERRGRTSFGILGLPIEELARFLLSQLGNEPQPSPRDGIGDEEAVVFANEDLKAYYAEAALAQPGAASGRDILTWIVERTAAGRLLLALQERDLIDGL
jgi:hypothetical protein